MYGRTYRSKTSAGKKRKQYRKRTTGNRKRTTMRKRYLTKNRPVAISAEKKYIEHGFTSQNFAKYNGAGSGYYVTNSTPRPEQGLGIQGRIGQKIFCTGCIMDVEIFSQTNVTNAIKYKYYVVRLPDAYDLPVTDIVPDMFDPNPFITGIYDWHSNLDPEKTSQFKIITKGQGTLRPDSISGQTSRTQFRKYLKLGFELKFDSATTGVDAIKNQWRIILFADTGDRDTAVLTGMGCSMNFRTFYLDN